MTNSEKIRYIKDFKESGLYKDCPNKVLFVDFANKEITKVIKAVVGSEAESEYIEALEGVEHYSERFNALFAKLKARV